MNNAATSLKLGEQFIDAFYSFDAQLLTRILAGAQQSIPAIVYYQGWARGGNYKIVNRMPCRIEKADTTATSVVCAVTVKDDLMAALGINFDVTDTFTLTIENKVLVTVATSSNDLAVFRDAQEWVQVNLPELLAGPCLDFFNGGPTPDKCVQAMVKGFAKFAASKDFPAQYQ